MSIEYKNKKINQSSNKTVINDKSINRYKLKKNYSENIKILPPIILIIIKNKTKNYIYII